MRFRGLIVGGALVAILAAAAIGAVTISTVSGSPATGSTSMFRRTVPPGGGGLRSTLGQTERAFAAGYAGYLDGAPIAALRDASVTVIAQARSGGRIPRPFRDGALRLVGVSSSASPFSAQVMVVLANREERYPLTVQLLREQHGWQVEQLQPPDLTVDETVRPVAGNDIPRAARTATRQFAIVYASFRAGVEAFPHGMTRAAALAVRDREDTLAGIRLPAVRPRLVSVSYGPLNEDEFAATATVGFGAGLEQQFSLLMQLRKQAGRWLCAAFL